MNEARKETLNSERIKIECRQSNHMSYFVDSNGLLKGEWGGFQELYDRGPHGEAMYEIYYSHFGRRIPINEFGFFYNKFSCKKYDGILKLPECDFYICEKNGRFGLINSDEKSILHTIYNEIEPYYWGHSQGYCMRYLYLLKNNSNNVWKDEYKDSIICIVTTESGKFLFNLSKEKESNVYDDLFFSKGNCYPQIIYKSGVKYGALDIEGNVLLKPYFDSPDNQNCRSLYYNYQNGNFNIWVEDGLLYRKIPSTKYEICFMVGSLLFWQDGCYFIFMERNKYGILNRDLEIVSEPILDEILLCEVQSSEYPYCMTKGCMHKRIFKNDIDCFDVTFVIAREGNKYKLFNVDNGHLILDDCDNIKYIGGSGDNGFIEFSKGGVMGFVLWNENIISTIEYEDVYAAIGFIHVKKDGKHGVFSPSGEELFPCIYDSILISGLGEITLIKDGKEEKNNRYSRRSSYFQSTYERTTYGRYAGSYAQDEMGYSDDDIDTVFDGDPSAYWNID